MDADSSTTTSAGPTPGGQIEPESRSRGVAKAVRQRAVDVSHDTHYELRDPFAEVTYRTKSFADMVSTADRLGSVRFVEIGEDGTRRAVTKTAGTWPSPTQTSKKPGKARAPGSKSLDTVQVEREAQASKPLELSLEMPKLSPNPVEETRARIEAALEERYLVHRKPLALGSLSLGQIEYRFRADSSRLAFTETSLRLATEVNNPSVARSMVDVAEARNWNGLRVSGHEDFKRIVWLEASVRGLKTVGYEVKPGDLELVQREREARLINRIEPAADAPNTGAQTSAAKATARGGGSRKAVLAAIEALLRSKGVPELTRNAVLDAAAEKLLQRQHAGQNPKVKVYDLSAPSRATANERTPDAHRERDRGAHVHVR
ncbi:LPD7 domain-containing protein [Paucibacter sp. B51]|uniref:LPD7 domain-containing protein n=1 Tax=Paucibacter sp. B51 TaxID=2993315 RepID=UPI0022EBBEF3|nr:LPD7 domain-containing protein [Paucibacter sp. B51]